jgi:hypothetical protein
MSCIPAKNGSALRCNVCALRSAHAPSSLWTARVCLLLALRSIYIVFALDSALASEPASTGRGSPKQHQQPAEERSANGAIACVRGIFILLGRRWLRLLGIGPTQSLLESRDDDAAALLLIGKDLAEAHE